LSTGFAQVHPQQAGGIMISTRSVVASHSWPSRLRNASNAACVLAVIASGAALTNVASAQLADFVEMIRLPVPQDNWVWLGSPPGDTTRVMAMEGGGTIRVLDITRDADGAPVYTLRPTPFLDPGVVARQARSVTFAPDFATSGRFYVAMEMPQTSIVRRTELNEYTVSPTDPNVAPASSKRLIWNFPDLFFDHAFGSMHFGADGLLYIGIGDYNNRANDAPLLTSQAGKIVRINPNGDDFPADPDRNYTIPAGNPVPNTGTNRPEIWQIGLRNPWRWSFDRWPNPATPNGQGDMWIFEVGGSNAGEINRVVGIGPPLAHYGWPGIDGTSGTAPTTNYLPPVLAIQRQAGQCSTSGGVVYRGSEIRPWRGRVFYADACEAGLRTARLSADGLSLQGVQQLATQLNLRGSTNATTVNAASMVAEDGAGELYILQAGRGPTGGLGIFRLLPSAGQPPLADVAGANQATTPDGQFTADDIIVFLGWYFAGQPEADVAGPNQSGVVDQALTADDIIVFLARFFAGT
jgi:hypothetical protein